MKQQISTMLELQDSMNSKVKADWREQILNGTAQFGLNALSYSTTTAGNGGRNNSQISIKSLLELVDIWHFGLSLLLLKDQSP